MTSNRAWTASALLFVLGATGCRSSVDLSPFDGADRGDALGDDGTAPEGSCSAVECSATCRAAGFPDGACRGPVCQCGSPDGCAVGETTPCYSGPAGTAGVGACTMGVSTCVAASGEFTEWGPCESEGRPTAEVCNEIDDDCDGFPDEDLGCIPPGEPCTEGDICLEGTRCTEFPSGRQVCDDPQPCSGPASVRECESWQACVEFPDGSWNCTDQPRTAVAGCAHEWYYAVGHPFTDCPDLFAASHADFSRADCLYGVSCDCHFIPPFGNDCTCTDGTATYMPFRTYSRGEIVLTMDFSSIGYVMEAEGIEYCMLLWGVHHATLDTSVFPPTVHYATTGPPARFDYRDIHISSNLYQNHHVFADPLRVPAGDGFELSVVWDDASTAGIRGSGIPYDYYGFVDTVRCETPTLPAGSTTYDDLLEQVWSTEVSGDCGTSPDVPDNICGKYLFLLGYSMGYYFDRGYAGGMLLTTELACQGLDGRMHTFDGFRFRPGELRH